MAWLRHILKKVRVGSFIAFYFCNFEKIKSNSKIAL